MVPLLRVRFPVPAAVSRRVSTRNSSTHLSAAALTKPSSNRIRLHHRQYNLNQSSKSFTTIPGIPEIIANEAIFLPELRVVDQDTGFIGDFPLETALELAKQENLDLILIDPDVKPYPLAKICKIQDYYNELLRKQNERNEKVAGVGLAVTQDYSSESQQGIQRDITDIESDQSYAFDPSKKVKGMRISCVADRRDLDRKLSNVRAFLKKGHRVQLQLCFSGTSEDPNKMGFRDPNDISRSLYAGKGNKGWSLGRLTRRGVVGGGENGENYEEEIDQDATAAMSGNRMVTLARRIFAEVKDIAKLGPALNPNLSNSSESSDSYSSSPRHHHGIYVERTTAFVNLWPRHIAAAKHRQIPREEAVEAYLRDNTVFSTAEIKMWKKRDLQREQERLRKPIGNPDREQVRKLENVGDLGMNMNE